MSEINAAERVNAPWSDDQVASLNGYQECDFVHPFTGSQGASLRATAAGWVEHDGGPVVQKWAHGFMADWTWKNIGLDVFKARAQANVSKLDDEQLLSIAKVIREAGVGLRTVATQADVLAEAMEWRPADHDAIAREMAVFHTLCNGMTSMLTLTFMSERVKAAERKP